MGCGGWYCLGEKEKLAAAAKKGVAGLGQRDGVDGPGDDDGGHARRLRRDVHRGGVRRRGDRSHLGAPGLCCHRTVIPPAVNVENVFFIC